jgi:cytochrome c-type biogenesis protein
MHVHAWFEHISVISPVGIALVALAGLSMGLAPSALPLASVIAGYVSTRAVGWDDSDLRKGLLLSAGFVLGMATVDAAVGILFGFVGFAVIGALAGSLAITNLVLGALLVVVGLALLRKVHIVLPVLRPTPRRVNSFGAAFGLGIPFGLSVCPACTPMVLPILGAAAATGTPWLGGIVLLVFGLARGIPLLIVGFMTDKVRAVPRFATWIPKIEWVSGVLLILSAVYFLYLSAMYAGFIAPIEILS